MKEKRINPETGVSEEKRIFGWEPTKNAEGHEERVNPSTGVYEEKRMFGWESATNAEGHEERVNVSTGIHEEKRIFGWESAENAEGHEDRVNPTTGIHEEKRIFGWAPEESSGGGPRGLPMGSSTSRHEQSGNASSSSSTRDSDSEYSSSASGSTSNESGGYGGFIALMIVAAIVWIVVSVTGIWQKLQGTAEPVCSSQTGQLTLDGECSYSINREDKTVTIRVNRIVNSRPDGHSGSIRLGLYAMNEPYKGGTISGSVLRPQLLDPLKGGWSYSNISRTDKNEAGFKAGVTYFLTLALLEHQNDNDYIVAWTSFPHPYIEPNKESWWKWFSRPDHPTQYSTDKMVASSFDGFIAAAERANEANKLANKVPMPDEPTRKIILEAVDRANALVSENAELERQISLARYALGRVDSNVVQRVVVADNIRNGNANVAMTDFLSQNAKNGDEFVRRLIIGEVERANALTTKNAELRRQLSLSLHARERAESNAAE